MPKITAEKAVYVDGLDELRFGLKAMGPEWSRKLGEVNKAAAETIAADARNRAEALGSTAAKAAPSVKSSAGTVGARVFLGSEQYPFALGAEFGAKQYKQFKPWRGNKYSEDGENGVGYFLWPAIRDDIEEVRDMYLDAIDDLSRQAFPIHD